MSTRIKCIFMAALASQIALFLMFYVLTEIYFPGKINRILHFGQGQKHSTHGISFLWDVFGLRADTEDAFLNRTDTNDDIQTNVKLVRRSETHGPGVNGGMARQQRTPTGQTTHTPTTARPGNSQPFQQIDGKNIWMYSAYFDHVAAQNGTPAVRVVGIARNDLFVTLYCNFSIGNKSLRVTGRVKGLPEHHDEKHHASYLLCNLPANVRPTHVSISSQPNSTSTSPFQIIYPGPRSRNFTVCYAVLHQNFNAANQLIQSIEMNQVLGAEHFMVYNYSISLPVDQILRRYQEDGLVTVLPWPVPTLEVHYYGQMAAINDCNYRNRNTSRFVVIVDTDEIIIPRYNLRWMELIDTISPQERDVSVFMHPSVSPKKGLTITGSFQFRSSIFTLDRIPNWRALPSQFPFSEEERYNTMKFKIGMLSQIWRSAHIYPARERSKYIARPELVYAAGIHFVHSFVNKARSLLVNPDMAIVHHYREDSVVDTSIVKFKNQLYPRLMQQYKRFPSIFS